VALLFFQRASETGHEWISNFPAFPVLVPARPAQNLPVWTN
jgi:hypothetical protein